MEQTKYKLVIGSSDEYCYNCPLYNKCKGKEVDEANIYESNIITDCLMNDDQHIEINKS